MLNALQTAYTKDGEKSIYPLADVSLVKIRSVELPALPNLHIYEFKCLSGFTQAFQKIAVEKPQSREIRKKSFGAAKK